MKHRDTASVRNEEAYLNRLGRRLLRYFPLDQVREILEDYQEHFSLGRERGGTDSECIASLGTPETVTAEILKEMPEGRPYFVRHAAVWGLLFLFSGFWLAIRYTDRFGWSFYRNTFRDTGSCVLLAVCAVFLFGLLRGREQAAVEGRFPQPSPRPGMVSYVLPVFLAIAMEALVQCLLIAAENDSLTAAPANLGPLVNAVLTFVQFILALLMAGSLRQAYRASIRSFPAAVSAAGALLAVRNIQRFLRSMDVSVPTFAEVQSMLMASCLLLCGFGLLLALLFGYYIRRKGRRAERG